MSFGIFEDLRSPNFQERRPLFQGITRDIRNFCKIIISEQFFVNINLVSDGTEPLQPDDPTRKNPPTRPILTLLTRF